MGDSVQPSVSAAPWIASFELARRTLAGNLEGISDSESLLLPAKVSNSVNWLAGHILIHRDRIHQLFQLEPAWGARMGDGSWYLHGGARAVNEQTIPLSAIRDELESSQVSVLSTLSRIDASRLAEAATPARTVAEQLALFGAHDWYHIGQIGVVRRLLGKPGAVG